MKKYLFLFMLLPSMVMADTVIIDPSGWNQEQKNMIVGMASRILFANGVTHEKIFVTEGHTKIDVINPSKPVTFLTTKSISDQYTVWRADMDIKVAQAEAKRQAKKDELLSNELSTAEFADIEGRIDGLTDIDKVKEYLKIVTKYIKAKE